MLLLQLIDSNIKGWLLEIIWKFSTVEMKAKCFLSNSLFSVDLGQDNRVMGNRSAALNYLDAPHPSSYCLKPRIELATKPKKYQLIKTNI